MALEVQAEPSHSSRRSLHWAPLRSWNLFANRSPSQAHVEQPPPRLSQSRSLRNHRIEDRGSRGSGHSRPSERSRKGVEGRAGSHREDLHRAGEGGGRQAGLLVNNTPSSSAQRTTATGNEVSRRRRIQGRDPDDMLEAARLGRSNTATSHHQHYHQHHHHDHHHYHYHHHYHQFPRQLSGNQVQGTVSSTSTTAEPSNHSSTTRSVHNQMPSVSRRPGVSNSREAAMEARDRLDERLRSAALLSHRHSTAGVPASFLDEFTFLFDDDDEDDDDICSDDEILELNLQDWLAAWRLEDRPADTFPSDEWAPPICTGLSKAAIWRLRKEVFVPKGLKRDKPSGNVSEQEDCAVCLESFLPGQLLVFLPCNHRFHPDCLTPWLEKHGHCPYCRSKISQEVLP